MKTIILMALTMSSIAFAGQENYGIGGPHKVSDYQPAQIYGALNVDEVDVNPGVAGRRRSEKSVGGLTCSKELSAAITLKSKIIFACEINQEDVDFSAIYKSLDVKETTANKPKVGGPTIRQKAVGGLTCSKSTVAGPKMKVSYNCKFIGE